MGLSEDGYMDSDEMASVHSPERIEDAIKVTDIQNEQNALQELISEEYCEATPSYTLDPIDPKLAQILTGWLRNIPPREKVKAMFKECMLPVNVDGLNPVRINSLVYDKLSVYHKVNDQKLRGINTFFARGLGPIVSIWDNLLKWESALKIDKPSQLSLTGETLKFNDLTLDISGVRRQIDRAIRLFSAGHSILLDRHRQQLKGFFDPKFHYLLKQQVNPITSELFGDNIDQKVCDSIKASDAA